MKNLKTKNGARPAKLCKERSRKVTMPKTFKPKTVAIILAVCLATAPSSHGMDSFIGTYCMTRYKLKPANTHNGGVLHVRY